MGGFMVYTVEPIVMLMEVQFLLLEQATWIYYGCGLSLCSQLVGWWKTILVVGAGYLELAWMWSFAAS